MADAPYGGESWMEALVYAGERRWLSSEEAVSQIHLDVNQK